VKRQRLRKWVVFGSMFAVWFAADILSKDWADTTLANISHPQPIRITEAEAGKTLGAVLAARFGWSDAELAQGVATKIQALPPAGDYTGQTKVFNREGPSQSISAFYLFWRSDLDHAPRRIERSDERSMVRWLGLALPKDDKGAISKAAYDSLQDVTFADWLPTVFRKLSADDVNALAADHRIVPIDGTGLVTSPSASDVVAVGHDYLLTERDVPVMGSWFKLIYAENPGAAFGFMKGVSPGLRQTLFMILTAIAFVVITLIVRRLPVHGWLVAGCFGAILSGAAGNFVDRIRFGYVIDFIDVSIGSLNWPTFNVADIAISVGVVVLMLDLLLNKKSLLASKKDKERAAQKAAKKAAQGT